MTDFVIFERFGDQVTSTDSLFIRLACDRDTRLQYFNVKNITMGESLGLMIPTIIIDVDDGSGDLINHVRLDTDAVYTLFYGRDMETANDMNFRIVDIKATNGIAGRSTNNQFKITMAHEEWQENYAALRNRAWTDAYISDIVREVIRDTTYDRAFIEDSFDISKNVIQSHSSNSQFMKSLANRGKPASRDGHYEFALTFENTFFFLSTKELIERGKEDKRGNKMPILRLGGHPPERMRDRAYADNNNVPIGFLGFSVDEHYMNSLSNGATEVEYGYFDWDDREYVSDEKRLSDLNVSQLSEWSLIRTTSEYPSKKMFGGRSKETESNAINSLSRTALNIMDIGIDIEGNLEIHSGDILEVVIPTGDDSQIPYSELYSGFYMVRSIQHKIIMESRMDFTSSLVLTRHGVDGFELSDYEKSSRGRVVI